LPSLVTTVDVRQAAFEALADDVRPGSVPAATSLVVDASPGGHRVNLGTPDLVVTSLPAGGGDRALAFEHGNPYPAISPLFAATGTAFQVPFVGTAADGTTVVRHTTSTLVFWDFVHRGQVTMAPVITPVRGLTVDGAAPSDGVQASTATPVVAWERPRRGRPA